MSKQTATTTPGGAGDEKEESISTVSTVHYLVFNQKQKKIKSDIEKQENMIHIQKISRQ